MQEYSSDGSARAGNDALPRGAGDVCAWCEGPKKAKGRFCSRKCRQSAFRFRRRAGVRAPGAGDALASAPNDATTRSIGDAWESRALVRVLGDESRQLDLFLEASDDGRPRGTSDALAVGKGDGYLPETALPVRQYFDDGACWWCGSPAEKRSRFCSPKCRHISWRRASRNARLERIASPMRFAYADPPYPGCAYIYKGQDSYAGEVDHTELIRHLRTTYEHWALSTSEEALHWILPLCPKGTRTCPWVKPTHPHVMTYGLHRSWEPVLVFGGRQVRPGKRDWLLAAPAALGGSDLLGRKPIAFYAFLFRSLGAAAGDTFVDLFPGSRMGERTFRELCRSSTGDTRRGSSGDE